MNLKKRVVLLFSIFSSLIYAQDTTQLTEVTILEKEDSIDLEEALKSMPKDISELLKTDNRFDIAGGSPNAKRFYIRGISDSLTNITIDGAKLNKDLFQHRGGLNNIDTSLLKSVQIDAGVAPADRGSGNLGAKVAFETVDAQDLLDTNKNIGGFISSQYGSVDNSHKEAISTYGKIDNVGILIYGSKSDSDDYDTGDSKTVRGSAEEVDNYLIKLSALDIKGHSIRLSHEQNTQEGLYAVGGPGSDFGYYDSDINSLEKQKIKRKTTIFNYAYNPGNDLLNAKLKLYKNDTNLKYLERTDSDIKSITKGIDLRNTFHFENSLISNNLTLGVDYEKEKGSTQSGQVELENKGVFAQNRVNIDKIQLSFGLRYDDYENDFIYRENSGEEISANINAKYFLTNSFSIFAGYGSVASGSNTVPIGWLTSVSSNLTFNGSSTKDLEPQKAKKFEIGADYIQNNLFMEQDNFNFNVTLFNTRIQNPIVVGAGGMMGVTVSDLKNDEDIQSKGFEISSSYEINKLKTTLSYSHSNVKQGGEKITSSIRRLAGAYGDKITANFNYKIDSNINLGYTITSVLKNDNAPEDVNNKKGYTLHDIQASYAPESFKNLLLSLSINNIFDKNYASQSSLTYKGVAVEEPGRDIRLSLKYTF